MSSFASKAAPTAEKLRGGYYTPARLARFLARWAAEGGDHLLEPSCGDGAVLRELARRASELGQLQGVELFADEAAKARQVTGAEIHAGDFFEWFRREKWGIFGGVAGNPPYIRFGNWPERDRGRAMELMEAAGLPPSRLTNAWVPFTVGSVLALREGGHFGLVLPGELMQVGYAAPLRQFLVEHCSELALISFRRLVFDGVLQEVILLLGVRGQGPAVMRSLELDDAGDLRSPREVFRLPPAPMLVHDDEKWTKYFLPSEHIKALRAARSGGGLVPLGRYASVEVGVVTGRNSFFTMTPSEARDRQIDAWCRPLVARSSQLPGAIYDYTDLERQVGDDIRCLLLAAEEGDCEGWLDDALEAYIRRGERAAVHKGYKCSIRRRWWAVPATWVPDGFMLRQIHRHPLMIANRTNATSTDTVHRVRLTSQATVDQIVPAVFNSATFAMAEILGRSYGGGILELEPTEARALPIPPPELIDPGLIDRLDKLLRDDNVDRALDLVDTEVLIGILEWPEARVHAMRTAWRILRDRRLCRGKVPSK